MWPSSLPRYCRWSFCWPWSVRKYVIMSPFPFTFIGPRHLVKWPMLFMLVAEMLNFENYPEMLDSANLPEFEMWALQTINHFLCALDLARDTRGIHTTGHVHCIPPNIWKKSRSFRSSQIIIENIHENSWQKCMTPIEWRESTNRIEASELQ